MENINNMLFPLTPSGEGKFRLFWDDGAISTVASKMPLEEKSVRFLVKDLFERVPGVYCVEVSSPNLGYVELFPRR